MMENNYIEIDDCEVCSSRELVSVLDLGMHPLCDDLVKINENRICKEYPIEILFCGECKTAHQRFQVPKQTLFTPAYHYRARMTGSVLSGMKNLVDSIEERYGNLNGKLVVDIGCNDGSLLDFFKEKGALTLGVEPTNAAYDSKHETINSFFDLTTASQILEKCGKPDIITFTNVFAHIEELRELIRNLNMIVKDDTLIVIENHYLGAVLDTGQFDTFYHEHPRTYSLNSFTHIAKMLKKELVDYQFVSRYGGNVRAYIGIGIQKPLENVDESCFQDKFEAMRSDIKSWVVSTRNIIKSLNDKYGKLRAKAFPGRAAILIKLLGLDERSISAVYEIKGSIKVGHYVPGTRIPILPESELYAETDQTLPILNLAWHLPQEVRANLIKNGYVGQVFDIK